MLTYCCGEYQRTRRPRRQVAVMALLVVAICILTWWVWARTAFAVPICEASASAKTLREGQVVPCSVDLSGNLRTGGSVTVADGADTAEGATTDGAITSNASGTVSGKLRGIITILADVWNSANHWLAVSIQNATLAVTQSGAWNVSVANFPATQPISGTVISNQGAPNATPWNQNLTQVGGVSVAATAKGTQASNFVPVQRPQDGGRTAVVLYLPTNVAITTEAFATLTQNKGGSETSGTIYTVTSGKTLRITAFSLIVVASTSTTACNLLNRLRAGTPVSLSSATFIYAAANSPSIGLGIGTTVTYAFPDGIEFSGGTQIGISYLGNSTSCQVAFIATGYEY